jgi:hypothetical protein
VFAALGFVYFLRKNCVAILNALKYKQLMKKVKAIAWLEGRKDFVEVP